MPAPSATLSGLVPANLPSSWLRLQLTVRHQMPPCKVGSLKAGPHLSKRPFIDSSVPRTCMSPIKRLQNSIFQGLNLHKMAQSSRMAFNYIILLHDVIILAIPF